MTVNNQMVDLTPNMLVFSLHVNRLNTAMNSKHYQTREKQGKTRQNKDNHFAYKRQMFNIRMQNFWNHKDRKNVAYKHKNKVAYL